jgi:hypothetical protein
MKPRGPERSKPAAATFRPVATGSARPGLMNKMLEAQQRERRIVLAEFIKVRGLMPLLMKHRNGDTWTPAERKQLQEQLRAFAHLSPYLVILALPGSFAFLPLLAWWLDRRRHRRDDEMLN